MQVNHYKQIVNAKLFIEENYFNELDLDIIASKAYYSKFHFIRLFKKSFGITPNQFLIETRLKNSKKLILEGFQIQEVCLKVGFDSISTFTSLFKKYYGITPKLFRKKYNNVTNEQISSPSKYIPYCFYLNLK